MEFILGESYQISFKKTKINYLYNKESDFYEVKYLSQRHKKPSSFILFKDLGTHIRMSAGFPKEFEGITITKIQ